MTYRKTERERNRLRKRHEHVVASACELVQQNGFRSATAKGIAEVAGVSVGSLYSNFDGLEELHSDVFRLLAERELRRVAKDVDAAGSPSSAVAALVRGFGARAFSAPRLAWALLLEPVGPSVEALRLEYRRDYANLAASIVREGIEAGEFSPQSGEVSAPAVVGAISESLLRPLDPDQRGARALPDQIGSLTPDAELVEEILRFCLRAVGAKEDYARVGRPNQRAPHPLERSDSR